MSAETAQAADSLRLNRRESAQTLSNGDVSRCQDLKLSAGKKTCSSLRLFDLRRGWLLDRLWLPVCMERSRPEQTSCMYIHRCR